VIGVLTGTCISRIAELKSELVPDRLDREHVAGLVLESGPHAHREDREDQDEDRRDDGPPELEHGCVVDLHADVAGGRVLGPPEDDREVDDVARDDVENRPADRTEKLEEVVDLTGRLRDFGQPDRPLAGVDEIDHDRRGNGDHGRDDPKSRA
jgi:hypothetical protein